MKTSSYSYLVVLLFVKNIVHSKQSIVKHSRRHGNQIHAGGLLRQPEFPLWKWIKHSFCTWRGYISRQAWRVIPPGFSIRRKNFYEMDVPGIEHKMYLRSQLVTDNFGWRICQMYRLQSSPKTSSKKLIKFIQKTIHIVLILFNRKKLLKRRKIDHTNEIKQKLNFLNAEIKTFYFTQKRNSVRRGIIPGNSRSLWSAVNV